MKRIRRRKTRRRKTARRQTLPYCQRRIQPAWIAALFLFLLQERIKQALSPLKERMANQISQTPRYLEKALASRRNDKAITADGSSLSLVGTKGAASIAAPNLSDSALLKRAANIAAPNLSDSALLLEFARSLTDRENCFPLFLCSTYPVLQKKERECRYPRRLYSPLAKRVSVLLSPLPFLSLFFLSLTRLALALLGMFQN